MSDVAMSLAVTPALKSFVWAFFFVVFLPVLITGGAVYLANKTLVFNVAGAVVILSVVLYAAFVFFLLRNVITLDARMLTVKAAFYERSVSRSDIIWAESRLVDFSHEPAFLPRIRMNGIGLPGYQAGWFRLANGTRAFLLVTHGPLAYLPVRGDEGLLLSIGKSSPLFEKIQAAESAM